MTEENKKPEEDKQPEDTNNYEAMDNIAKANEAAERTERATRELKKENDRRESMIVEKTLGGKADAGKPMDKEETPQEYAKRAMNNDIERS